MDAKSRKALIDSLALAANFDPLYTEVNRRWMIGKALNVIEGRNAGDAVIKSKIKDVVNKAKTLVTKHHDFKISIKINAKEAATERLLRKRRVEILYGMIAYEPDLVDPANEKQLLFVAKRRYRTVERFQFYINPNGRGYLRYPETCKTDQQWRVNFDAKNLWEYDDPADDYPLFMKTPPNPPDIVKALEKIFIAKDKPCEGNLFDCATALSFVYMDSFLEARIPKKFLELLYARAPRMYLRIDHVHGPLHPAHLNDPTERNKYFLTDLSANTTFTKEYIPQENLQIGDHVYIQNHGIYKTLMPRLAWQGEHALLTDCGNRAVQSDNGFRFMGHGMPRRGETGAIPRFYGNLLNELNTKIYRYYRIGGIFLHYMKSGGTAFPGQVTKQTATGVPDIDGGTQTVDFYFFNVDFKYQDYVKKAPRGAKFAQTAEKGFVAWHIAASREFGVHEKKTIAAARTDGIAMKQNGVRFLRLNPAPPAEMFDPLEWAIRYPDNNSPDASDTLTHFVFQKKGTGMVPLLLEMWELYSEPFGKFYDPTATGIFTTRPKVDVGTSYTTFLTSSEAI